MSFYKVFILILTSFIFWGFFTHYIYVWFIINNETHYKEQKNIDSYENNDNSVLQNNNTSLSNIFYKSLRERFNDTDSYNWIDTELIDQVYGILKTSFYSFDSIDEEGLVEAAVGWMIEWLWDPNSEFLNPERKERFLEGLSWDFEGIGAVVEKVPQWVKVQRLLQGSPALEWGIRAWDIIVSANEELLSDLDLFDAVEKIRWPAWSLVVLDILREDSGDIISKDIIREKIQIPSIDLNFEEDDSLAHIMLNQFWEQSSREFYDALEEVINSDAEWIILDLRNNGGGFLESAVEILSYFIPRWEKLVSIRYRDSRLDSTFRSNNVWNIVDLPIVVLINENSASAAEITAWALREYNKAIIIWKKSFWKWSVQQPFEVEDSLLKLTVAHWYTPLWRSIETEGIEPDIKVDFQEEDFENEFDRQLHEAKRLLKIFIDKNIIGLAVEEFNKTKDVSGEELENLSE